MSDSPDRPPLLADIVTALAELGTERTERGMVSGRRASTIAARQAPANLDVLVLRDPRTGALATLLHWGGRVRQERPVVDGRRRSVGTEIGILAEHWEWALEQSWGPQMVQDLNALWDLIHVARYGVPVRPCPVCGEPVRVDRFVIEHRACLDSQP